METNVLWAGIVYGAIKYVQTVVHDKTPGHLFSALYVSYLFIYLFILPSIHLFIQRLREKPRIYDIEWWDDEWTVNWKASGSV
jgi:hypothetical protein